MNNYLIFNFILLLILIFIIYPNIYEYFTKIDKQILNLEKEMNE
jgi:hypothetical protein